jgi:NADPH:quinone reductase-like Zn-dependent oxidoreductase
MQAVQFPRYGGPDVLGLADQPTPRPSTGERLIEVHAVSVNPIDWKLRSGFSSRCRGGFPPRRGGMGPGSSPGLRPATTRASWERESAFSPRGGSGPGRRRSRCLPIRWPPFPPSLAFTDAAALPLAGLSAWAGLVTAGRLESGSRVLIHGGSGGVGGLAVQLARHRGAYVISTCSARNAEFVLGLGRMR